MVALALSSQRVYDIVTAKAPSAEVLSSQWVYDMVTAKAPRVA